MHVRVAVPQKGLTRIGKFLLWLIMLRLDKSFHQSDLLEIFITVPCGTELSLAVTEISTETIASIGFFTFLLLL